MLGGAQVYGYRQLKGRYDGGKMGELGWRGSCWEALRCWNVRIGILSPRRFG